VLIIGLVVLLAAVGTAVGLETYYRKHFENCIANQADQQLGSKISVHFGAKPLLLTAIDHQIGSLTIDSDDAKFGPAVGMKVHATLHDITMQDGNSATVGSSNADATWSDDGIAQTLTGLVSGVQSNPSTGTLDVKMLGGIAGLQLQPHIVDNKIQVDTQSANLLGIGLPTDLVNGIVKTMTSSLQNYPLDMRATGLQVTDSGIHVTLAGGATKLDSGNGTNNSAAMNC
jgi:hypothetical protein